MSEQLNREEVLKKIESQIKQCDAYNSKDSNPFA